ncbi:hypothetical protein GBAR_LOCUS463, partial [Geodia barretti]
TRLSVRRKVNAVFACIATALDCLHSDTTQTLSSSRYKLTIITNCTSLSSTDGPLAGLSSPTGADTIFSQHSPPPLPFGIQTQGFIIPGPGCPPFSPPPPPLLGPFPFIPPQFNPGFGYGPPFFHGPMNISQFPPQGMPPLVPYNVAN